MQIIDYEEEINYLIWEEIMMKYKNKGIKIVCILMAIAFFIGCSAKPQKEEEQGRPSPSPLSTKEPLTKKPTPKKTLPKGPILDKPAPEESSSQKPSFPKALKASGDEEPNIDVYIKDEDRTESMKFEEYVKNVVAGEIKNDWPEEVLKAQAIIARTFVMNFIAEKGSSKYGKAHISTDIEEAQAWNPEAVNDRLTKAVEDTRGQVMVYEGEFAQAWFHSNAAGMTATPKEGLNYKDAEPTYIKAVESPDDSPKVPAEETNWEYKAPKDEVIKALGEMGKSVSDISKVSIGEKGKSGRAINLNFGDIQVSAPDFRIALGSTEMKSTMLDAVDLQGDVVVFKGRGYGHGVGMSQWGAYKMGEEGKKAEDIISHYFKGVKVVNMWK